VRQDKKKAVWKDPTTNTELNMSRGFTCTIQYHDGTGRDRYVQLIVF